jgi:methylmalonyl-CoA/ethylmalonyl-CoA epimerase
VNDTCIINHIDHVGVAVRDIEKALLFYQTMFDVKHGDIINIPEQEVIATLITIGQTRLELIQPLNSDTSVGRFLERRGEGLHHLALNVGNLSEAISFAEAKGLELIDRTPKQGLSGLVAFIHPRSAHGVLTELVESVP